MIIWGYIFTILDYVFYCLSRFMKKKAAILALDLIAKLCIAFALYCFNSLSGAFISIAVFFMLIVANIKEHLHKEWIGGYIFFQSVYFIILYTTYIGISSILVVLTVSVNLFCIWFLPPQQMRFIGGINCFTYLAYQISIKNWAGLLEIFAITSNILSYIKYRKKRRLTAKRRAPTCIKQPSKKAKKRP